MEDCSKHLHRLRLHPASLAVLVAVDSYLTGLHRSERASEEGLLSSSRLVEHILPALQASLTSPSSEVAYHIPLLDAVCLT